MALTPAFVPGIPGGPELLVIVALAVLLFGANKIPELARSLGQSAGEFKRGRQELEEELDAIENDVESAVTPGTEARGTRDADTNPTRETRE